MFIMPKYVKRSYKVEKSLEIAEKLQALRKLGHDDSFLEKVIDDLSLPFEIHLFVKGNFTRLMENKIIIRMG